MSVIRTFKYRVYPTQEQAVLLNKTFGCARLIYNCILADNIEQYKTTGKVKQKTHTAFKAQYPFLSEVDSFALTTSYNNVKTAYNNFFRGLKEKKHIGFPRFHSKHGSNQSYTTYNNNGQIRLVGKKLRLPKVGLIEVVWHRRFEGKIKHCVISKTKTNKYYISICCEAERPQITEVSVHNNSLGIDMAFHKEFAVLSSGKKTNFPNWYLNSLKKIAILNRRLARTQKGSNNHKKVRLRLARVYERNANQLKDWTEKLSFELAESFDNICVEDIDLRNMSKLFGKQVLNNGFGYFRTRLEQKVRLRYGNFVKADKWFPSSQVCNRCGFRNKVTKDLSVREYICPSCGSSIDRDYNASLNLAKYSTIATMGSVCGGTCKTCKETHCALIQATSCETEKIVV